MLLHEELRHAREQLGITQAELGTRAGIPRNQIVRAEKGENITLDTLRKIVVQLPVDQLTLLKKVKLNLDVLPQADKIYFGVMKSLLSAMVSFQAAMELAFEARDAMEEAHREATPNAEEAAGGKVIADLLPLRSMQKSLNELNEKLREANIV